MRVILASVGLHGNMDEPISALAMDKVLRIHANVEM